MIWTISLRTVRPCVPLCLVGRREIAGGYHFVTHMSCYMQEPPGETPSPHISKHGVGVCGRCENAWLPWTHLATHWFPRMGFNVGLRCIDPPPCGGAWRCAVSALVGFTFVLVPSQRLISTHSFNSSLGNIPARVSIAASHAIFAGSAHQFRFCVGGATCLAMCGRIVPRPVSSPSGMFCYWAGRIPVSVHRLLFCRFGTSGL